MIPTLSRLGCLRRRRLSHQYYVTSSRRYNSTTSHLPPSVFRISPEVQDAVHSKSPVVALETTIYTHGFPYPDNVALASHLESVVRLNGGVPATIGVLNGVARVGLTPGELIELAEGYGKGETMKVSRRDLPYITGLVSLPLFWLCLRYDLMMG
jgi:pseudouridylate synthase / pseudouridine kinase